MAVVPTEIGSHRRDEALLHTIASHDGPIASFGHLEPSWIFYSGRRIHEFHAAQPRTLTEFLSQHPNSLIITTPQRIEELGDARGVFTSYRVVHETQYFLRNRPLLLVRPDVVRPAQMASHAGAAPPASEGGTY